MEEIRSAPDEKHSRRMRRMTAAALLIVAAVAGAREVAIPVEKDVGPGSFLFPIALAFLAATWCLFDGRLRGKPPVRIGLMAIVLALPIAFPVYCFWSRGPRGILLLFGSVGALLFAGGLGGASAAVIGHLQSA
jgi:hypothetical protein